MSKAAVAYTQKRFGKTGAVIETENALAVPACQQNVKIAFLNEEAFKIVSGVLQYTRKIGRKLVSRPVLVLSVNVFMLQSLWVGLHIGFIAFVLPKCTSIGQKKTGKRSFGRTRPAHNVYVRRRACEELNSQCVTSTVKHGGSKIQVWGCFTANGVGYLNQY